jgi:hypothetical protein
MNPDAIFVLIPITFFLTTGAVLLFRPITKRLGLLLEAMAKERQNPAFREDLKEELARVREMQELLSDRLALMEERQEFTDQLLRSSLGQEGPALPRGSQKETSELRLPGRK